MQSIMMVVVVVDAARVFFLKKGLDNGTHSHKVRLPCLFFYKLSLLACLFLTQQWILFVYKTTMLSISSYSISCFFCHRPPPPPFSWWKDCKIERGNYTAQSDKSLCSTSTKSLSKCSTSRGNDPLMDFPRWTRRLDIYAHTYTFLVIKYWYREIIGSWLI